MIPDGLFVQQMKDKSPLEIMREAFPDLFPVLFERFSYYDEMRRWFTGEALGEVDSDGKPLYPLRLNPLPTLAEKHVNALLGEHIPGRLPVFHKARRGSDVPFHEETLSALDRFVNGILLRAGNHALVRAAWWSQVFGGFFIMARPSEAGPPNVSPEIRHPLRRRRGIIWEFLSPEMAFAIPSSDFLTIEEFFLVRIFPGHQLRRYFPQRIGERKEDLENMYVYIERWTPDEVHIYIDDEPAAFFIRDEMEVHLPLKNGLGYIPVVYIPHPGSVEYYGKSIVEDLYNLIREMNLRWADVGLAVKQDSIRVIAVRDTKNITVRPLAPAVVAFDLGQSKGLGDKAHAPDMWEVGKVRLTSEAVTRHAERLWEMITSLAKTPPIAFGKDEGSQRSALTLQMRFWPLTAHADMERMLWEDGLRKLVVISLDMAKRIYGKPKFPSDIADPEYDVIRFQWNNQLPRDREGMVQEAVARVENALATPRQILASFPDVDDPDTAEKEIRDWLEFQSRLKFMEKAGLTPEEQRAFMEKQLKVQEKQAAAMRQQQSLAEGGGNPGNSKGKKSKEQAK